MNGLRHRLRYTRPMISRALCLALLVALAVPACGLKGPLYLPDQKPPPASGGKASALQKK